MKCWAKVAGQKEYTTYDSMYVKFKMGKNFTKYFFKVIYVYVRTQRKYKE